MVVIGIYPFNKDHTLYSRRIIRTATIILLMCVFNQSSASALVAAGWIEKAQVLPQGITLHAKLDTGAKTTSIHAPETEFYEKNGDRWVRFKLTDDNENATVIEAKVVRDAKIKRHYGKQQVRPVIMLEICIGNIRKNEEVNLVDRSNLNYPLLVGRNFLKGAFLIDSGSTYRLLPDCSD